MRATREATERGPCIQARPCATQGSSHKGGTGPEAVDARGCPGGPEAGRGTGALGWLPRTQSSPEAQGTPSWAASGPPLRLLASAPLPPTSHVVLLGLPVTGPSCPLARDSKPRRLLRGPTPQSLAGNATGRGEIAQNPSCQWVMSPKVMPNAYEIQEDTSTTKKEPSGHVISPEMQACCLELSGS